MDKSYYATSARLQHAQNQYESLLIRAGEVIDHVPNPNGHANSTSLSDSVVDNSFDSTEESIILSDHGVEFNTTHTHTHWNRNITPGRAGTDNSPGATAKHLPPYPPNVADVDHNTATKTHPPTLVRGESDGFALQVEEDEKLNIIITLQAEVVRLKGKLDTTLTSAETTIGDLYQAHSTAELANANKVGLLTKTNNRLEHENLVLRQQLEASQKALSAEKGSLLEATHLIRRLHSRHKIITHGLLPPSKRNSISANSASMKSKHSGGGSNMRSSGSEQTKNRLSGRKVGNGAQLTPKKY